MSGIYISYRHEDTADQAGRLYDVLVSEFGPDRVMMDMDTKEIGRDYVEVIQEALVVTDVMLVLIGQRWLTEADATPASWLNDPDDSVHIEITGALARRDVRVVPVLLDGATVPRSDHLPDALKLMARRRGIELRDTSWDEDVSSVVAVLRRIVPERIDSAAIEAPPPAAAGAAGQAAGLTVDSPKHRDVARISDTEHRAVIATQTNVQAVEAQLRQMRAKAEAEASTIRAEAHAIRAEAQRQAAATIADAQAKAAQILASARTQQLPPVATRPPTQTGTQAPGARQPPAGTAQRPTVQVPATQSVVILGVPSYHAARGLESALRSLAGVTDVRMADYNARSLTFQVTHRMGSTLARSLLAQRGMQLRLGAETAARIEFLFNP